MINTRNPNREFTKETREQERTAANNACRICGKTNNVEWLQCAHIYTLSMNSKWERAGSDVKKWKNDNYVNSVKNCVLLCKSHHGKIDSVHGLQKVNVEYLESLGTDMIHCTALIGPIKGQWRRCRKINGRGNSQAKGNGYRCALHLNGGHEETLVARNGWNNPQKKNPTNPRVAPQKKISVPKKSRQCIVM
jgi:hypothetical protein